MRWIVGSCCVVAVVVSLGCQEPLPVEPLELTTEPEVFEEVAPAPESEPAPVEPVEVTVPKAGETSYVVQRRDTLYSIARKLYGEDKYWKLIYEANRDRISDPNLIRVGTELRIPPRP